MIKWSVGNFLDYGQQKKLKKKNWTFGHSFFTV